LAAFSAAQSRQVRTTDLDLGSRLLDLRGDLVIGPRSTSWPAHAEEFVQSVRQHGPDFVIYHAITPHPVLNQSVPPCQPSVEAGSIVIWATLTSVGMGVSFEAINCQSTKSTSGRLAIFDGTRASCGPADQNTRAYRSERAAYRRDTWHQPTVVN
jgi:hypothetical protein